MAQGSTIIYDIDLYQWWVHPPSIQSGTTICSMYSGMFLTKSVIKITPTDHYMPLIYFRYSEVYLKEMLIRPGGQWKFSLKMQFCLKKSLWGGAR